MPTSIKENYLKALHFLSLQSGVVSLTELGNAMEVSKPTVNDMVKKLAARGWVKHERYQPIQLTSEGHKAAALVIRKHRLSELFLYQVMGFGWEEVHDIAEEMEHIKSEHFFQRMDEMLRFPVFDPHGSPIPDKAGNMVTPTYQLLSQISSPRRVALKAIRNSGTDFLKYLNEKNLQLGIELKITSIESFDGSISVSYGHCEQLVMSHSVSSLLWVEVVE